MQFNKRSKRIYIDDYEFVEDNEAHNAIVHISKDNGSGAVGKIPAPAPQKRYKEKENIISKVEHQLKMLEESVRRRVGTCIRHTQDLVE